jgi:hypothetical protein
MVAQTRASARQQARGRAHHREPELPCRRCGSLMGPPRNPEYFPAWYDFMGDRYLTCSNPDCPMECWWTTRLGVAWYGGPPRVSVSKS